MMQDKKNIAIIGAAGYTGIELLKIIASHGLAEPYFLMSRTYDGKKVDEVFPSLKNSCSNMVFSARPSKNDITSSDVVFLCLPPGKSMEFFNLYLRGYEGIVIDIGSDFRIIDAAGYQRWYGLEHQAKDILGDFVYGLSEIKRNDLRKARYIANPGCYPTSVLLGVIPLLAKGIISGKDIIVDSKSGVTGAGRKLEPGYLFGSLNENFYAYKPLMHRHIGEIENQIKDISGSDINISFTPHLLPVDRGIFSSIYIRADGIDSPEEIDKIFTDFYKEEEFIGYFPSEVPQIKDVTGTNNCNIGAFLDKRTSQIKVFTVIDNLIKGAAGQAVQNMNIALGIKEDTGLKSPGFF